MHNLADSQAFGMQPTGPPRPPKNPPPRKFGLSNLRRADNDSVPNPSSLWEAPVTFSRRKPSPAGHGQCQQAAWPSAVPAFHPRLPQASGVWLIIFQRPPDSEHIAM